MSPYIYKSDGLCTRIDCYDLVKWLSQYLYFFSFLFLFGLITQERSVGKCHMSQIEHHIIKSHDNHGKIVHRSYSSCISSIQEIDKNSIKFFLSTQT